MSLENVQAAADALRKEMKQTIEDVKARVRKLEELEENLQHEVAVENMRIDDGVRGAAAFDAACAALEATGENAALLDCEVLIADLKGAESVWA